MPVKIKNILPINRDNAVCLHPIFSRLFSMAGQKTNLALRTLQKWGFQGIGTRLFILFSFFIFIAKPLVNITYAFLMLLALIHLVKHPSRQLWCTNRYLRILTTPFLVGFVLSFFSLAGGIKGPVEFLARYRFLLLVLPFALFVRDKKTVMSILSAMNLGALANILYCLYNSDLLRPFEQIIGIYKISRNADMMFSLFLFNATFLLIKFRQKKWHEHKKAHTLIFINTVLILSIVIFIGQRAAYVGLFAGLFILFVLFSRKLLAGLIVLTFLSPLFAPAYVVNRTKSIVNPAQQSNSERLDLLVLGADLFIEKELVIRGTGAGNIEPVLEALISTKSPAYQEAYKKTFLLYPDNFHNSYLQMTIEGGLIFFSFYFSSVCYLIFKLFKDFRKSNLNNMDIFFPCIIVTSVGFLISQVFHEEFFRYGGLVFFLLLYCGCMIETNNLDKTTPGPQTA